MKKSLLNQQAILSLLVAMLCFSFNTVAQADLTVYNNIRYKKAPTLHPSGSFSVNATVRNTGTSSAGSSRVRYYLSSDTQYSSDDWAMRSGSSTTSGQAYSSVSSIAAGGSTTISRTIYVPSAFNGEGYYYILFRADADNQVTESDEGNNVSPTTVQIVKLGPDMTITNASFRNHEGTTNGTLTKGTTANLSCYMQNIGDETAGVAGISGPYAGFYISDNSTYSSDDVRLTIYGGIAMDPGDSRYISRNFTVPTSLSTGTKYLLYYADYDSRYNEGNENNNIVVKTIQIANAPTQADLYTSDPYVRTFSNELEPGLTTYMRIKVRNGGSVSSGTTTLKYYLSRDTQKSSDDIYAGSTSVSSISAGSYRTVEKDITIPSASTGLWYVLFVADANNQVSESNENNNVGNYSFNMVNQVNAPDFTIQNVSVNPGNVFAGNATDVTVSYKNLGAATSASPYVGFYLSNNSTYSSDDVWLGLTYTGAMGANQVITKTTNVTIPEGTPAGNKYIVVAVNRTGNDTETDLTNNIASSAVTIVENTPAADLITQYPNAPSTAATGSSMTVSCRVKNQGNVNAGSSYVKVYLTMSTNTTAATYIGQIYTPGISAGGYRTVSGTVNIPADYYAGGNSRYVKYVADGGNVVTESDDNNNAVYESITITEGPAPDLSVSSASVSPSTTFPAGATVTVSATVRNLGNASAGNSVVKYYLSQNSTYGISDTYLGYTNLNSIAAGSSQNISKSITMSSSLIDDGYFILVRADANGQIDEEDEYNNVDDIFITISNGNEPDLTIENHNVSPTSIVAGSSTIISCRVKNIGAAYTQAGAGSGNGNSSFQVYLSSNTTYDTGDTYLGYQTINNLAPGGYADVSKLINIPSGTSGQQYILFVADKYGWITESNENNNVFYTSVYISGGISKVDFNFRNSTSTEVSNQLEIKQGQNPMTDQTTFTYNLPQTGNVKLSIRNINGKEVATLVKDEKNRGKHQATFQRGQLPNGIYIYTLVANGKVITGRLVIK